MTERDQQIASLRQAGHSQRAIARALGISHVAVGKHLRKLRPVTPGGNHTAPDTGELPAAEETVTLPPEKSVTTGNHTRGAPTPPPPEEAQASWQEASLDTVLTASFRHGLRLLPEGSFLHFAYPPNFPPGLQEALERYEDDLLWLVNRTRQRHPPCAECGSRLLFRRRGDLLCPICQGRLLGPDWVWARW